MLDVSIRNPLLIKTLNTFSDYIFTQDADTLSSLKFPEFEEKYNCELCCSKEYLEEHLNRTAILAGFPLHVLGYDINTGSSKDLPVGWSDAAKALDDGIMQSIGVQFSALKMYYPANGYIGWHNNCNCPGQNLLMTYSAGGNGYFEYLDPITKEIVRMEDRPGWTAKVGYYGSEKEPDKILWHCAKTYEPRLTVSYVIRDQSMWEYMVEDIQSDQ